MFFVFGAFSDPLLEKGDLLRFESFVLRGGRHDIVVGGGDAVNKFRSFRITFDDDRLIVVPGPKSELLAIEAERVLFRLAGGGIRTVAVIAILGEDRLDLVVERDGLAGRAIDVEDGCQKGKDD
jgi:hypothetical protein